MSSYLIVKTSALGDIIQAFPVVQYLHERDPHAQIDWLVEDSMEDCVRAHPYISHTIAVSTHAWRRCLHLPSTYIEIARFARHLRRSHYDVVFDLQGNTKSGVWTSLARARDKVGFGWKSVSEVANVLATRRRYNPSHKMNIRQQYLHLIQSFFGDLRTFIAGPMILRLSQEEEKQSKMYVSMLGAFPRLLVACGSRWPHKQLPFAKWVIFLKKIAEELSVFPQFCFLYGSEEEKRSMQKLQGFFPSSVVWGNLSLPLIQTLMTHMDQVIGVDSVLLHLAGLAHVSTFGIFGPSSSKIYQPETDQHSHYQGICPYGQSFTKRCPALRHCPTGNCMREMDEEALFKAWRSSLDQDGSLRLERLRGFCRYHRG